ncbi:hypothetical protein JK627_23935 [Bacillus paranthracis]|uniref:head fiber protein n=1 Tax=Bacillus paranthracis TaxID=2026186 RepID=UPI003A80DBC2
MPRVPRFLRKSYDKNGDGVIDKTAIPQAATQADSTATDVAGLKTDFNALLAKLKTAGLMK